MSNKALSKKRFGELYRHRWRVEIEIKVLRAIRLWIMAVWHVVLLKLGSKLEGIDFRRFLESLVFPVKLALRRCLRFSPFPDDRLILLMLQDLIGGGSCFVKV